MAPLMSVDAEAQARIARTGDSFTFVYGYKLEEYAVHVKTGDVIARLERETEDVAVEGDRLVHVFHVVVQGVEGELEVGVGHGETSIWGKVSAIAKGWVGRGSQRGCTRAICEMQVQGAGILRIALCTSAAVSFADHL